MGSIVARVILWCRLWWLTVPEPRAFSLGWGVGYAMIGAAGASVLVAPGGIVPPGYDAAAAVLALGVLNIVGMAVAMLSGYRDFWKGERLGISLMLCATLIYLALIVADGFGRESPDDGAAPWYIGFAVVVLSLRWVMIRRFTFRPRG